MLVQCGMQRQLNKDKAGSTEVVNLSRPHIKQLNSHDKTIQTRTFRIDVIEL